MEKIIKEIIDAEKNKKEVKNMMVFDRLTHVIQVLKDKLKSDYDIDDVENLKWFYDTDNHSAMVGYIMDFNDWRSFYTEEEIDGILHCYGEDYVVTDDDLLKKARSSKGSYTKRQAILLGIVKEGAKYRWKENGKLRAFGRLLSKKEARELLKEKDRIVKWR